MFRDFGGNMRFRGKAATVKCFEVGRGCRGGLPALGGEGGGGGVFFLKGSS